MRITRLKKGGVYWAKRVDGEHELTKNCFPRLSFQTIDGSGNPDREITKQNLFDDSHGY